MAERKAQPKHDRMIRLVADRVLNEGHSHIKADIGGFEKPEVIYQQNTEIGYKPDVTSTKYTLYIFEVETEDSIDDPHTEDQWKSFYIEAQRRSGFFIVVVPPGSEQQARARAEGLGIALNDVWTVS